MTIFPLEIKAHLKELKARGIILIGLEDYTECLGSPETYYTECLGSPETYYTECLGSPETYYTECLGSPETYYYMTEWKGWKTAKEAKAFISKEFGINPISYRNGVKTEIVMS